MARDGILMRFHAAIRTPTHGADGKHIADLIATARHRILWLPAQGQIRRGHDFDKIHVVEGRIVGHLLRPVERVDVVVCPRRAPGAEFLRHALGNLRPEA